MVIIMSNYLCLINAAIKKAVGSLLLRQGECSKRLCQDSFNGTDCVSGQDTAESNLTMVRPVSVLAPGEVVPKLIHPGPSHTQCVQ